MSLQLKVLAAPPEDLCLFLSIHMTSHDFCPANPCLLVSVDSRHPSKDLHESKTPTHKNNKLKFKSLIYQGVGSTLYSAFINPSSWT